MTDGPEKIWVHYEAETDDAMWSEYPDTDGLDEFTNFGEYTRTDIVTAMLDVMTRRIKFYEDMSKVTGSIGGMKREKTRVHALSEALGEMRKILKETP